MKIQKRIALVSIFVAIVLWALSKNESSAEYIPMPQYEITDPYGSPQVVPLGCDEMVEMKELAMKEGKLREADSFRCGTYRVGKCLPYYLQDAVLHELDIYLKETIRDNCKVS